MAYILDGLILAVIGVALDRSRWRKARRDRRILCWLMYGYVCCVLAVTLMPFQLPIPGGNRLFLQSVNWIPFRDLRLHYGGAVREVVLNVLMMAPFGFLLPLLKPRQVFSTAAWTFLFSLSIETMQLLYTWSGGPSARSCDVTDLITNTLGGVQGYLLFWLLRPWVERALGRR